MELMLLTRCQEAANDGNQSAQNQCEANVFRLAAMIVLHKFPRESRALMAASDRYFSSRPEDKLLPEDAVRNGWILSLPRFQDMLVRKLKGDS